MTGVAGLWLAALAVLALAAACGRAAHARGRRRPSRPCSSSSVGTSLMRADTLTRFAEFLGLRDRTRADGRRELRAPHAARVHRGEDLPRPPADRRRLERVARGVGVRAAPRRRPTTLPDGARPGVPVARAPLGRAEPLHPGAGRHGRGGAALTPRPRRRGDRRRASAPRPRRGSRCWDWHGCWSRSASGAGSGSSQGSRCSHSRGSV